MLAYGTPLQYSCLENPMDGGAWWAAVHGVAKSQTRLSDFSFTFTFMHWRRKWQPIPVFLHGDSQGWGRLVGCCCGVTQSRTRLKQLSSSMANINLHNWSLFNVFSIYGTSGTFFSVLKFSRKVYNLKTKQKYPPVTERLENIGFRRACG